jgi:predicted naringenin-chalcone synthase
VRTATITGAASALPAAMDQRELWDGFFRDYYGDDRLARRMWASAGVRTRHGVANPVDEDLSRWTTGQRMERYLAEALPLGKDAVSGALADAGLGAVDLGLFAVASCTGYVTPGVDILLARDLGMAPDVQRLVVGHMGCYAALPGLGAVTDFVLAHRKPALLLCLELTSLHVQPPTPVAQVDQVVCHALFSDAASAVVVVPDGAASRAAGRVERPGLGVVDIVARTDAATSDHMTWDVTDLGFRMGLSACVPDVLARYARPVVTELLGGHGLTVPDVAGWAVHPGGPRILDVIGSELELPDEALAASRAVLRDCGNCSSATVLLVLERLREQRPGAPVVALAFGPGLTLYAALLRAR